MTSLDTVVERATRSSKRPLAAGADRDRLQKLFDERMPAYRQADVLVETDGLTIEQSVGRILMMIEPHLKSDEGAAGGS